MRLSFIFGFSIRSYSKRFIQKNKLIKSAFMETEESMLDPSKDFRFNDIATVSQNEDLDKISREQRKNRIIRKKEMGYTKDLSIITRRAVEQICFLISNHKFTFDDIRENFPVADSERLKLENMKIEPMTQGKLIKSYNYSMGILSNIKGLYIRGQLDKYKEILWLINEDKVNLLRYCHGNESHPMPEITSVQLYQDIDSTRIKGELESIYRMCGLREETRNYMSSVENQSDKIINEQEMYIQNIIFCFLTEEEKKYLKLARRNKRSGHHDDDWHEEHNDDPIALPNKVNLEYHKMFLYKDDFK